ncbi:MAG: hypothetical protein LBQ66_08165 [Planctomycetaceae bacterium]|nr:hypothetical protein [Planctomycetaceae bacterium]
MILVILSLILQTVGLHRSVENDAPTSCNYEFGIRNYANATIGQVTGLHSYGMRRLGGGFIFYRAIHS